MSKVEMSEEMLKQLLPMMKELGIDPGVQGEETAARPVGICVDIGQEVRDLGSELGDILRERGLYRFQRGFVTVNEDDPKNLMEEMRSETFVSWVQEFVTLQKYNQKKEEFSTANMTETLAKLVMSSHTFRAKIPFIKAVLPSRLPVMRDGVEVLLSKGYNPLEKIFVLKSAPDLDEEMDLDQAMMVWRDVYGEFPLDGARSQAAHAAAAIGIFCQYLFPDACAVPLFQYTANMEGAGKSLLARSAVIPIYTLDGFGDTDYSDSDKFKEELNSIAYSGKGYLFLDDLVGSLFSSVLNRWVTSPTWEFRKFHSQLQIRVDKRCMTIISDNGVTLSDDLIRRSVIVRFEVDERAGERSAKLKRKIDEHWLNERENRGRIMSMWWAFVRHWREQGCPAAPRTIPSFHKWSQVVGGVVFAAFGVDPFAPAEMLTGGDKRRTELDSLIRLAIEAHMGEAKSCVVKLPELCALARQNGLFDYPLRELELVRLEMDSDPHKHYDYTVAEDNVLTEDQRHFQASRKMHPQKEASAFSKRLKKQLGMKFQVGEHSYRFTKDEKSRTAAYNFELVV